MTKVGLPCWCTSESYINKIGNKKSLLSISGFFYIYEYLNVHPRNFFDDEINSLEKLDDLLGELKKLDDRQLDHLWQSSEI
jgi:hypothetical protein